MNLQTYIGCAVTVILREGSYHGIIHRFDSFNKRITLKDVSNPVSGNKYPGIRHFYASEILDIVLDDDYDDSLIDGPPCVAVETDEAPAYEDVSSVMSLSFDQSQEDELPDCPPAKSCDRYTLIDKFNDEFHDSMTLIKKQKLIGFQLMSIGERKRGKICWITISVDRHVYLFDFLALGKKIFKHGLSDVLESKIITKVIHDCRFISDLLFHKYSVNLTNVFDTQVADAFVYRTWYGAGHKNIWPKFVQPLSVCLFGHLNLSTEEIAGLNACEGRSKVELELWPRRPLSASLAETLVCCVKYLIELRQLLIEKMMVEYMAGVDIYLNSLRDLPDSEVHWYANKSEFFPKTFHQMNKFTQFIKDSFKSRERKTLSDVSPLNNDLEKNEITERISFNKMHITSKSGPVTKLGSPTKNTEDSESHESPVKTKNEPVIKEKPKVFAFSINENKTNVSDLPVQAENNLRVESRAAKDDNNKDDILIQAARKMIASDIPADLMELLKTPVKSEPVTFDSDKIMNQHSNTRTQDNLSSSSQTTGVEWARYRKENVNSNELSLRPAGCNMAPSKKKGKSKHSNNSSIHNDNHKSLQKSPPNSCQQFSYGNRNSVRKNLTDPQQNEQSDIEITDTFLEIPETDSYKLDNSVLGQTQTYSVPWQRSQHFIQNNNNNPFHSSYDHTNSSSINSPFVDTKSTSHISASLKASHSTEIAKQEDPADTNKSTSFCSSEVPQMPIENGTKKDNFVNGNVIVGNGGMTHIERLMAVWRNNCK